MQLTPWVFALSLMGLIFSATPVAAQEESVPAELKAAVKKEISEYIERDVALKGAFLIKDKNEGSLRELKFESLHEGVHKTPDGKYVACVDFKQGNKLLDVDFYMKPDTSGKLSVSDIVIHKIDGKKITK